MTTILAGALLDQPPGRRYRESLRFAELAPREPLPSLRTLRRWRSDLPEEFVMSLVAPRGSWAGAAGPLRLDEGLKDGVAWLLDAAEALAARAIVIATGSEVTTGQRDRDRLAAYFEAWPRPEGTNIVWAPAGLWEPEQAARQAARMNVLCAFDPLEAPPPAGPVQYARLQAIGGRQRFTEGMLHAVHDRLEMTAAEEALVTFDSPRSHREAATLQRLVDDSA
jgi:uncharacterized protein YecE (DUF72 family)